MSLQAFTAGFLAAFAGFAGSFAVFLAGLTAVGASPAQAATGLMAGAVAMGLCGIVMSLMTRMPVSAAWSTPGAALLVATGAVEGGFAVAVGAFAVVGLLVVISAFWSPLGRAVQAIPGSLANAMLAGVLLGLCLAPVKAVALVPEFALPVIAVWAVVGRWNRLYAVPAAAALAFAIIGWTAEAPPAGSTFWPAPEAVMPRFSVGGLIGLALPLFIVTMASQNVPGFAVLQANGYRPPPGRMLATTGLFTLAAAPFGGQVTNLAAIIAALCAGPDAHPEPARRYWAAVTAGLFFVLFGLGAGYAIHLIEAAPPALVEAVAGLALLGAFAGAVTAAVAQEEEREAAVVTFVVTASGLTLFGIGGAFWGLVAGGAMLGLKRLRLPGT